MAWGGTIFSDPTILSSIGNTIFSGNPTAKAGVSFLSNLLNYSQNKSEENSNKKNYYASLAKQKALSDAQTKLAMQRMAYESAARKYLTTQNTDMISAMRKAQSSMGAMPQFNEGQVQQDYQAIKANQMNDFNDMLSVLESQGRAAQIERLGGADSRVADEMRVKALATKMTPLLSQIDQNSYDAAIQRATNKMNLYNTSRSNTLDEIKNTLQPGISNGLAILNNSGATDSSISNSNNNSQLSEYGTNTSNMYERSGQNSQTLQQSLADLLSRVYNKTTVLS